jgi:hypothetical protein
VYQFSISDLYQFTCSANNVLALNVAEDAELLPESLYVVRFEGRRRAAEVTDPGHSRRLLPLGDERCSRNTERQSTKERPALDHWITLSERCGSFVVCCCAKMGAEL